jgi:hypothetical protein
MHEYISYNHRSAWKTMVDHFLAAKIINKGSWMLVPFICFKKNVVWIMVQKMPNQMMGQ